MTNEEITARMKRREAEFSHNAVIEALTDRAETLRRCAAQIDQRIADITAYDPATGGVGNPKDFLNWAINDLENCLRNMNFAELARKQAAYELSH